MITDGCDGLKRRKATGNAFTRRRREKFLDALALTCNIRRAAEHAGVNPTTVQRARVRDPAFAAQWQEALSMGFDRLEALVLEHGGAGAAIEGDPGRAIAEGVPVEKLDLDRALKVLQYFRGVRAGEPNRRGGARRPATREETNATLMRALAAAKRRMERARRNDG